MQRPLSHDVWNIIGAGPVGSMLAVGIAAIFPEQETHIFDQYRSQTHKDGLLIKKDTIDYCCQVLTSIHKKISTLMQEGRIPQPRLQYYHEILRRIHITKQFLQKHFPDQFIRTHQISEMLQTLSRELGKDKIEYHLNDEMTAEDLALLTLPNPEPKNEKQRLLLAGTRIFGADGIRSGLRTEIFGESNDDLSKENLNYLLEIQLALSDKNRSTLDSFTHAILSTLKSGNLHIWNQSGDGTATLHIFINKKTYELMHVKGEDGRYLVDFGNAYKRLIDLPQAVRSVVEAKIVDIIDVNKLDASTLQVTAIPFSIYKARFLIMQMHGRLLALLGDAAVGLILSQRGINLGLCSAMEYVDALFDEQLQKAFSTNPNVNFALYQRFLYEQMRLLEEITKHLPNLKEKAKIINLYEKLFQELVNTDSDEKYAAKVKEIQKQFTKELFKIAVRTDANNALITALFEALKKRSNILARTPMHACQDKILARADQKIEEIHFENTVISKVGKIHDSSMANEFENAAEAARKQDSQLIAPLLNALKNIDAKTAPPSWVLIMDRLFLHLEKNSNRYRRQPNFPAFVALAVRFVNSVALEKNPLIDDFLQAAKPYTTETLLASIRKESYTHFNFAAELKPWNELVPSVEVVLKRYIENDARHLSPLNLLVDKQSGLNRANAYKKLLGYGNYSATSKILVLYAIITNEASSELRKQVFYSLLSLKNPRENFPQVTSLDYQVLAMQLRQLLAKSLTIQTLDLIDTTKNALNTQIEKNLPCTALGQFEQQTGALSSLKQMSLPDILNKICHSLNLYVHTIAPKTSLVTSSLFKETPQQMSPAFLNFIQNKEISEHLRLAMVYAILKNERHAHHAKLISDTFFGANKALPASWLVGEIGQRLSTGLKPEDKKSFDSLIYRIGLTVLNSESLEKEHNLLQDFCLDCLLQKTTAEYR